MCVYGVCFRVVSTEFCCFELFIVVCVEFVFQCCFRFLHGLVYMYVFVFVCCAIVVLNTCLSGLMFSSWCLDCVFRACFTDLFVEFVCSNYFPSLLFYVCLMCVAFVCSCLFYRLCLYGCSSCVFLVLFL